MWNKFLGIADLGTDEMWKTWPQLYETDGDNYIDLCLQLNANDNDGKDIVSVSILANSVFPPRGTGPNIAHQVRVTHIEAGGNYPYNLVNKGFADKIYDIYLAKTLDIVAIAGTAGSGIVAVPLIGLGIGVGLLFFQSFVPVAPGM